MEEKGGEVPEEQQWQKSAEQRARERQQAVEIPQALRALGQDFLPGGAGGPGRHWGNPFSGSQGEGGGWPVARLHRPDRLDGGGQSGAPPGGVPAGDHRGQPADAGAAPAGQARFYHPAFRPGTPEDGTRLLLLDLPEPGFDPDLKAILDEQKKPVTFWAEGWAPLPSTAPWDGLRRRPTGLEARSVWIWTGTRTGRNAFPTSAPPHGGTGELGRAAAGLAARDLLELANDWASDGGCEEREPGEITRGQFMERLEPDAVQISGDGSFDFWFNDGALFWGHSIHVTGSLEGGPEKAEMEADGTCENHTGVPVPGGGGAAGADGHFEF